MALLGHGLVLQKLEYPIHLDGPIQWGRIRKNGLFCLESIETTSQQATQAAHRIIDLFDHDKKTVEASGKATATTLHVFQTLQRTPVMGAKAIAERCGIAHQTALRSLNTLESAGIIKEISGRKRGQIFSYSQYLAILSEGTEPLPR